MFFRYPDRPKSPGNCGPMLFQRPLFVSPPVWLSGLKKGDPGIYDQNLDSFARVVPPPCSTNYAPDVSGNHNTGTDTGCQNQEPGETYFPGQAPPPPTNICLARPCQRRLRLFSILQKEETGYKPLVPEFLDGCQPFF